MINYSNEKNRRDLGFVWIITGLIFLFSGFSGGGILLLLGIIWLASTNDKGLLLFENNPKNLRTLLRNTTIGLLAVTLIVLIFNAIP